MSVWQFFQISIQTGFEPKYWSISNVKNSVYGWDVRRFPHMLFGSRSGPIWSEYVRELRDADFTETVVLAETSLQARKKVSILLSKSGY